MAKLLLVEDDNNLREIYQARLTAEGYDIVTAADGEEALSIAKTEKPDLIISDVMMPRISGFEMLDILRNTDELKHVKVIMLTALGQAEDRGRADNLGADKYLVKSQVTLEDIVSAARDLLDGGGADATAPSEAAPAGVSLPAPEPTTTAAPEPVAAPEPEIAVAPEPVPAPAVEPVTPVEPAAPEPVVEAPAVEATPAVTPVAAAEPAVTPPEPVTDGGAVATPVVTAVPVSDPDPLTPAPQDDTATVDEPSAEEVVAASDTPAPAVPAGEPVEPTVVAEPVPVEADAAAPAASAPAIPTMPAGAQDIESEEAVVQAQIDSFVNAEEPSSVSDVPVAAPEAPAVEMAETAAPAAEPEEVAATPAAANDALLQQAVEDLTTAEPELVASPAEVAAASEAPSEEPTAAAEAVEAAPEPAVDTTGSAPETDNVTVTGKKVIKPLSDLSKGPDLDALLAKEEAKAADTAVEPTPIVDGETKPPEPQRTFDPNKIAL